MDEMVNKQKSNDVPGNLKSETPAVPKEKPVAVPLLPSLAPDTIAHNTPLSAPAPMPTKTPQPLTTNTTQPKTLQQSVEQVLGPAARAPHAQKTSGENPLVRPLRTYRDDIASLIKKGGTSYLSIATAQYQKRGTPAIAAVLASRRTTLLAVASIALVLAGIGTIFYFYFARPEPTPAITLGLAPLLFTESTDEANITGLNHEALMVYLLAKKSIVEQRIGSVTYLYQTTETPAGKKLVPAGDFLRTIEARVPAAMLRALADNFMFGFHEANGNQPFLVFKTTSFDQSFAGMLAWEPFMRRDLAPLFGNPTGAATTAGSAEVFRDRVIKNKDARILSNADGSIALIYSFVDTSTVIIATNQTTFNELVTRLVSSKP